MGRALRPLSIGADHEAFCRHVSLEQWSLCVISREGKIVAEGKALSEPETLARWVRKSGLEIERVGLEAGPLSQWLTAGLEAAGFEVALLENRFSSSRPLGPYLGLTPRRYQSGETDIAGRISCAGDAMARSALYEAATVILTRAIPLTIHTCRNIPTNRLPLKPSAMQKSKILRASGLPRKKEPAHICPQILMHLK